MKIKTFAFNGFQFPVPNSWELLRFKGDRFEGELSLGDGPLEVMALKWKPSHKKGELCDPKTLWFKKKSVKEVTLDYIHNRVRKYKDTLEGHEYFVILDDEKGRSIFIQCQSLDHLLTKLGDQFWKEWFLDEEKELWNFFYIRFELARGFELEKSELIVGTYLLRFKRNSERLSIWVRTLAQHQLSTMPLRDWTELFVETQFPKRYKWKPEEGSEGSRFVGKRRWRWNLNTWKWITENNQAEAMSEFFSEPDQIFIWVHEFKRPEQKIQKNEIVYLGP